MSKIVESIAVQPSELVDYPDGRQRRLKLIEPSDGNSGPTRLQGSTPFRPRSNQHLAVKVNRSGDFSRPSGFGSSGDFLVPSSGPEFVVKPDFLRDAAGDDVVDELNWMGKEDNATTHYNQILGLTSDTFQYHSPKMCRIENWDDYAPAGGVVGFAVCVRKIVASGDFNILAWRLRTYDHTDGYPSYAWESSSGLPNSIGLVSATYTPSVDAVEMPDGSIVVTLAYDDAIETWKSYDCGDNFVKVSETELTSRLWWCANERIGSRLIQFYAYRVVATSHTCYARYSDDGGLTWSSQITVYDLTEAPKSDERIEAVRNEDGRVYLIGLGGSGLTADAYVTSDGESYTSRAWLESTAFKSITVSQRADGSWDMYAVDDNGAAGSQIESYYTRYNTLALGSPLNFTSVGNVVLDNDTDGLDMREVCARTFGDDGFVDMMVTVRDAHSGSYYGLTMLRLGMWSGVQMNDPCWDRVWLPIAYPSTDDDHPNENIWSRVEFNDYTTSLESDEDGHLELTTGATGGSGVYYYETFPTETYDTGVTIRAELKMVDGSAHIRVWMCSDAGHSDKDARFTVIFGDTNSVYLWDDNASAIVQTFDATNWDLTEYNEFLIVAKENEVQVYRAPSSQYREFAHYELIIDYDALQEDAFSSDLDRIFWGIISTVNSEVHWRSLMYVLGTSFAPPLSWDFDADMTGRRIAPETPLGVMQEVSARFGGVFALEGDEWEMDVGAVYEAANIFIPSPSISWRERDTSGSASPATDVAWEREADENGNDLDYRFDALAVFGRNWVDAEIYGENAGGGGAVDLGLLGTNLDALLVDTVDKNAVTPTFPSDKQQFVPGMYASDGYRFYYLKFHSGALAGKIYKVIGNDETRLFLEVDVETLGAANLDSTRLFSDRFLYLFDSEQSYPRLKLSIGTVTTSPSEDGLKVGTVVLGKVRNLPAEEWGVNIQNQPAISRVAGRAGLEDVVQLAGSRRFINLSFTGLFDSGMGKERVFELVRSLKNGQMPAVWVDDELVGNGPKCYPEPVLARISSPYQQRRVARSYEIDNFGGVDVYKLRNVFDGNGVVLEEIL